MRTEVRTDQKAEPIRRTGISGLTLALGAAVISGVSVFVNGHGVTAFGSSSSVYTTAKNLIAAAVLGAALVVLTRRRSSEGFTRPRTPWQWTGLAAVAVIGGSVPFLLFFEGLSKVSSTQAAFLQKSLVVYVTVLAIPILGERIGVAHLAAIGLLLSGLATMQGGVGGIGFGQGERLIVLATILWAVEIIVAKPLLRSMSSLTVGVARMGGGALILMGYLAATGKFRDLVGLSASQWGWAALVGLILAAYVATWFAALARARAVDVTAILVFGAVITAFLQWLVDGVPLRPEALGLVLITIGAALVANEAARRGRAGVLLT
jgi:drug/metabolite transporter (DMT)-like permease